MNFKEVGKEWGFDSTQVSHGLALADLDNDGDQDIYHQLGGFFPSDKFHNALFLNPGNGNAMVVVVSALVVVSLWFAPHAPASSAVMRTRGAMIVRGCMESQTHGPLVRFRNDRAVVSGTIWRLAAFPVHEQHRVPLSPLPHPGLDV